MAGMGPEMLTAPGLFTAAISRPCSPGSSNRASAASREVLATAMPPRPNAASCWALRWKITRTASSRLSAPAASAAATSPTLWPSTMSGTRP